MWVRRAVIAAMALLLVPAAGGQERSSSQPSTSSTYVTREEYEALRRELDSLKQQLADVTSRPASERYASPEDLAAMRKALEMQLADVRNLAEENKSGFTHFLIAGDASAGFLCQQRENSTFSADFSPMFLWQLSDRLFFSAAVDFALATSEEGGSETDVELELANLSYLVNDYIAVIGGKFPLPLGDYHTHLDPPWINKLPDDPLALGERALSPEQGLGFMVTGAFPIKSTIVNYGLYVTNGPALIIDDRNAAGSLDFENYSDINDNKAFGGRIGFLPIAGLEIGYSMQCAAVSPDDFPDVDATLYAVDLNFVRDIEALQGRLTVQSEWVWSRVTSATYDPLGLRGFGPVKFRNNRDGGYVLLAYRPTMVNNHVLRNLEFVFRYDRINSPSRAPGGGDEQRWTPGIAYWFSPKTVFKIAAEFDERERERGQNTLMCQFATGL